MRKRPLITPNSAHKNTKEKNLEEQTKMIQGLRAKQAAAKKLQSQDDAQVDDIDLDALEKRLRESLGDEQSSPEEFHDHMQNWLYERIKSFDLNTIVAWVNNHPVEGLMAVGIVYLLVARGFNIFPFEDHQSKEEERAPRC